MYNIARNYLILMFEALRCNVIWVVNADFLVRIAMVTMNMWPPLI